MTNQSQLLDVVEAETVIPEVREGAVSIKEHILEIVSDSGEGAQKCGQTFGTVSGKMGNGVWTVEIIPAEIQPPAREPEGASGIRIRFGSKYMTNMGDEADFVVALNEQVLKGRIDSDAYKKGTVILLENMWATDPLESIRDQYQEAVTEFREAGLIIHELPIERECLKLVSDPRKGKNMFVLGMLCHIYSRDAELALAEITKIFKKKSEQVIKSNHDLFKAGYAFAQENIDYHWEVPAYIRDESKPTVVMSGNQAIGLGVLASGMELVATVPDHTQPHPHPTTWRRTST